MKKKDKAKLTIQKNINWFKCTICGQGMDLRLNSIICKQGHNFDLSKKGYVNFLAGPVQKIYHKKIYYARSELCKRGFFDPLVEKLAELMAEELRHSSFEPFKFLDAGCGEGFILANTLHDLRQRSGCMCQGFGLDIAKEGIQLASRDHPEIFWAVADLANLPFQDNTFHFLLNVLSPANYQEFSRAITDYGTLLKVVPGKEYLQELRQKIYKGTRREFYSNIEVIERLRENFNIMDTHSLCYNILVTGDDLEHLVKMTPLTWGASQDKINWALKQEFQRITVDLFIIRAKKSAF